MSPGGKYLLYYDEFEGHWFSHRLADGLRTNLTERVNASFRQESHDTPDMPGSYGTAGWTADDRSVLLYDRYDIWEMRPDGSNARMLTNGEGRAKHLVFRYRTFDADERTIPTTGSLLLTTTNEDTRASGFSRVAATGGAPSPLLMIDKAVGAPTKAKNADVVVFTQSRFEEYPDLWLSNTSFATPRKVTNANPQQAEYVWGKAENIEYTNADGKKLKAMLIKPDNFDPTKKYPMMVYIY
jgi:dipeptidyl aminopeptidase/acylaminoacyl peptidase